MKARLVQSGHWEAREKLDEKKLMDILLKKIKDTDFIQAKADVLPFVKNPDSILIWSKDFFISLLDRLKTA